MRIFVSNDDKQKQITVSNENVQIRVNHKADKYCTLTALEVAKHVLLQADSAPLTLGLEHQLIRDIPVLSIFPDTDQLLPLVILVHGFKGAKESNIREGIKLARSGFYVALMDARLHGQRRASNFQQLFADDNPESGHNFFTVVKDTASDISTLVSHFREDQRVDSSNVGLGGISMGGIITFLSITQEPAIKAAAPLIATPDWLGLAKHSGDHLSRETMELLSEYSPLNHYQKMPPCPLLIQNATNDPIVPVSGTRKLNDKIRSLYPVDHYKYIEYPELNHNINDDMIDEMISWFSRFLKRKQP